MGNDLIKKQFDDIDGKIDFMIELCQTLQLENKELILKIKGLEAELVFCQGFFYLGRFLFFCHGCLLMI